MMESSTRVGRDGVGHSSPRSGGRLVYARPEDLPSYPSAGLKSGSAAASAAASLGWSHRVASAPEAMATKPQGWTPRETLRDTADNKSARSAAASASQAVRQVPKPRSLARPKSSGVLKGRPSNTRTRSASSPELAKELYPDERNAASNALAAATMAAKLPSRPSMSDLGAVPYTTMGRDMFTSHPPVQPEVEEKKHAQDIHNSAVEMAKKMYHNQQWIINAAKQAEGISRPKTSDGTTSATSIIDLHEAAYKLAQERLAKLRDEHQKTREFYEYYGSSPPVAPQHGRFAVRNKLRRRASSEGAVLEDRRRAEVVRQQMSTFSSKLSRLDEDRRTKDRQTLLAAAQRNVKTQLEDMDKKVYAETGKVTPVIIHDWEAKARAAAIARSEARKDEHAGQVDVGGGRFVDPKVIDEIAAKRVQPLIDDINEKAEKERERRAALEAEEQARRLEVEKQRAREKEVKDLHDKLKGEQKEKDRLRKQEIKREEHARKEEEKAAKAEQKRRSKEEHRLVKEPVVRDEDRDETQSNSRKDSIRFPKPRNRTSSNVFRLPNKLQTKGKPKGTFDSSEKSPKSPSSDESSPTARMKNWLKSRFSRPRSKSTAERSSASFVGGHTLMHADGTGSMSSLGHRSSSLREVALAGKPFELKPTPRPPVGFGNQDDEASIEDGRAGASATTPNPRRWSGLAAYGPVSSLSSNDNSSVEAGKEGGKPSEKEPVFFTPPLRPRDPAGKHSSSPERNSRFFENLDDEDPPSSSPVQVGHV